jgi:hypothetical protein
MNNIFEAIRVGDLFLGNKVTPEFHQLLYRWAGFATVSSVLQGFEADMFLAEDEIVNWLNTKGKSKGQWTETNLAERVNTALENTFFNGSDRDIDFNGYGDLPRAEDVYPDDSGFDPSGEVALETAGAIQ